MNVDGGSYSVHAGCHGWLVLPFRTHADPGDHFHKLATVVTNPGNRIFGVNDSVETEQHDAPSRPAMKISAHRL